MVLEGVITAMVLIQALIITMRTEATTGPLQIGVNMGVSLYHHTVCKLKILTTDEAKEGILRPMQVGIAAQFLSLALIYTQLMA
jgi:hypothetical protein